jgi:MFS superfamily sulfate permease-like transporter
MTNLKDLILNEKTKGIIAIVAAVIMWFTPNHIDRIIESLLGIYGITVLTLQKKKDSES